MCHDKIHVNDASTEDCFPTRLFIKDFNNVKSSASHHGSSSIMKYVNMIIHKHQVSQGYTRLNRNMNIY